MTVFWAFGILLVFLLIFVVAIRSRFMAWGWNFALVAVLLYAGLFKMTGSARDAYLFSTIEQIHGDVAVLWQMSVPHKFIYLLITKDPSKAPYYLQLPWSKSLDQDLQEAMMEAQRTQSEVHADADALSKFLMPGQDALKQKTEKRSASEAGSDEQSADKKGGHNASNGYQDKEYKPQVFYPKPVPPDPNKNYRTIIEGSPTGPLPDAGVLLEQSN